MGTLPFDVNTARIAFADANNIEGCAPATEVAAGMAPLIAGGSSSAATPYIRVFKQPYNRGMFIHQGNNGLKEIAGWVVGAQRGGSGSDLSPDGRIWTAPEAGLYEILAKAPVLVGSGELYIQLRDGASSVVAQSVLAAGYGQANIFHCSEFAAQDQLTFNFLLTKLDGTGTRQTSLDAINTQWVIKRLAQ